MQITSSISRSIVVAGIATLLFTGCGTNGSQFNPVATRPMASQQNTKIQPDTEDPTFVAWVGSCWVYWVSEGPSVGYYIYEPAGCDPAEGIYRGGAYASAQKASFVGEVKGSTSSIGVYNNKLKQVNVLAGLTGDPVGIATDAKGDVWATNYPSNTISEYNPGATEPSATYADGNLSSLRYIAVDKDGSVYVSGQGAGSGSLEVDELQASTFTPIKTITGAVGAGIAIAPKTKTLWVCDEGDGTSGTISGYAMPGFKRRMQIAYSGDDTGIAVAKSGKEVYAIDNVTDGSAFDVSFVAYDAKTGKAINSTPSITTSAKVVGIADRK